MKLISGTFEKAGEFLSARTNPLSLDELFKEAQELGTLETGSWEKNRAELKCNFVGSDLVFLRCSKYSTLNENIAEVIAKARKLKQFYASL